MTQTTGRIFDDLARVMTDAAGVAQGVRREVETVVRSQGERFLQDMDIVPREEFDAMKAVAQKAREEVETLKARVDALEAKISAD